MAAKKFTLQSVESPVKQRALKTLAKLRHGYYYSKGELAKELGFRETVIPNWLKRWPELREYYCYMRLNGCQTASGVFVSKSFRKELIKKNLASEKFQ